MCLQPCDSATRQDVLAVSRVHLLVCGRFLHALTFRDMDTKNPFINFWPFTFVTSFSTICCSLMFLDHEMSHSIPHEKEKTWHLGPDFCVEPHVCESCRMIYHVVISQRSRFFISALSLHKCSNARGLASISSMGLVECKSAWSLKHCCRVIFFQKLFMQKLQTIMEEHCYTFHYFSLFIYLSETLS